uniref:Uncharacterized protein n=1 Tax=Ditylenchus dipsaci TaxID=166011 RepID=A0A915DQ62_9BILA
MDANNFLRNGRFSFGALGQAVGLDANALMGIVQNALNQVPVPPVIQPIELQAIIEENDYITMVKSEKGNDKAVHRRFQFLKNRKNKDGSKQDWQNYQEKNGGCKTSLQTVVAGNAFTKFKPHDGTCAHNHALDEKAVTLSNIKSNLKRRAVETREFNFNDFFTQISCGTGSPTHYIAHIKILKLHLTGQKMRLLIELILITLFLAHIYSLEQVKWAKRSVGVEHELNHEAHERLVKLRERRSHSHERGGGGWGRGGRGSGERGGRGRGGGDSHERGGWGNNGGGRGGNQGGWGGQNQGGWGSNGGGRGGNQGGWEDRTKEVGAVIRTEVVAEEVGAGRTRVEVAGVETKEDGGSN